MYIIIFLLSIWQSILFWEKEPGISVILFIVPFIVFLIKYLEKIENQKQFWNIKQILNEYENKFQYSKNYDLIYLINTLRETYNKVNNINISWQEFNISKIMAKKVLEEKL